MRWVIRIGGTVVALFAMAAVVVYVLSERRISRKYQVRAWAGKAPSASDSVALERGKHIAQTRGCLDCHKADGRGGLFADAMPVMRLVPENITPGGVTKTFTDADWERAIRHCVTPAGDPIPFMPCVDNAHLADEDLGPLITYMRTLAPVDQVTEGTVIGPLGRVLFLIGELPYVHAELIDHEAASKPAPAPGPTAAYGAYLGEMCVGCHGMGRSGGPIPGVPPEWPAAANITPHESGLKAWTQTQFVDVMRKGVRPDGRKLDPQYMPWKQFANFSDDELAALWLHLRELPAKEHGGR